MSYLGLHINELFSTPYSSKDNFLQDFVRRLGGRQVVDVDKIVGHMQEAIKEVCGESVGDIESMYNPDFDKNFPISEIPIPTQAVLRIPAKLQKVLLNLGRKDKLFESGRYERLLKSMLKMAEDKFMIDEFLKKRLKALPP